MNNNQRLDSFGRLPEDMAAYLEKNGWHFSKKLCDYAVSKMRGAEDKKLESPYTKEKLDALFKQHGIEIRNDHGYDTVYVANMLKCNLMGPSIPDELHLLKGVKRYLDDPDGYPGVALTRYFADCIGKGTPLLWGEFI